MDPLLCSQLTVLLTQLAFNLELVVDSMCEVACLADGLVTVN